LPFGGWLVSTIFLVGYASNCDIHRCSLSQTGAES